MTNLTDRDDAAHLAADLDTVRRAAAATDPRDYAADASTIAALRGALSRVGAPAAQIARRAALAAANMVICPSINNTLVRDVGGWVDLTALYTGNTSLSRMTRVLHTRGADGSRIVEDTRTKHKAMLADQDERLLAHIAEGQ